MAAEEWLWRRLRGLQPTHFGEAVGCIACSPELSPPETFRRVWVNFTGVETELDDLNALLVFSNPFVPEEMLTTLHVAQLLHGPRLFWIPHTVAPEDRPAAQALQPFGQDEDRDARRVVDIGFSGLLTDEPEGMRLALQVRKEIHRAEHLARGLDVVAAIRRARQERFRQLKGQINTALWDYLRVRIALCIPVCSADPPSSFLKGGQLGRLLGHGTLGSVFGLDRTAAECPREREFDEVVMVIDKASVRDVHDVKRLKNLTQVMLKVSSAQWRHPNIMQLLGIHHSRTRLMFRQEYCGCLSLCDRLRLRQLEGLHLSVEKVSRAIKQLFAAVAHLHEGPGICLRDLKPESFLITETAESLEVKLADFGLAMVLNDGRGLCKSPCGTVPFVAPEVLSCDKYNGRAGDMWSLGVILLQVLCGVPVVESAVGLKGPPILMAKRIAKRFGAPEMLDSMLTAHTRREVLPLLPACQKLAHGVLTVDPPSRWRAKHAVQVTDRLDCSASD